MKISIKRTISETHTYKLSDEIKYIMEYVNGKEKSRNLIYKGSKINGYSLSALYDFDGSYRELLKRHNPYWGDKNPVTGEKIFNGDIYFIQHEQNKLPDPEDIDLSKIILCQSATHEFFELNKEPIPVVMFGDYIDSQLRSGVYFINKLHEHLSNHPNVLGCSKVELIPYYNNNSGREKYFKIIYLPEKEWLLNYNRKPLKRLIQSEEDYFNIKQFEKPKVDYYD